uniref:Uncharacterized protein MANES_13G136000 n=1 Tax=Rhizophora mucronata TaxID=61149 RepID=A0A2P2IW86_RHIMU
MDPTDFSSNLYCIHSYTTMCHFLPLKVPFSVFVNSTIPDPENPRTNFKKVQNFRPNRCQRKTQKCLPETQC